MKKKLEQKLLTLHKETLLRLSERELNLAQGGATRFCDCGTSSDPTVSVSCPQHVTVCDC
jgi:hypothetical protein